MTLRCTPDPDTGTTAAAVTADTAAFTQNTHITRYTVVYTQHTETLQLNTNLLHSADSVLAGLGLCSSNQIVSLLRPSHVLCNLTACNPGQRSHPVNFRPRHGFVVAICPFLDSHFSVLELHNQHLGVNTLIMKYFNGTKTVVPL